MTGPQLAVPRARTPRGAASFLVVLALLGGCGSDGTSAPPTDAGEPTTAVPTTETVATTEAVPTTAAVTTTSPPPTTSVPPTTAAVPTTSQPDGGPRTLAIANHCADEFVCTQLANTEDGRLVAYDPADETLRVYDPSGQALQLEVPLAEPLTEAYPWLVHIGPDDVAYVLTDTPGIDDPSNDLLAIPLLGARAGTVIERSTGLDGSGDSRLVPATTGLVVVGCCGPAEPRPAPDAALYPFVDRNGAPIGSTAPTFRLDLGDAGNNLVRVDGNGDSTSFRLPVVLRYPRDMPTLVATDDGGALALDYVEYGSAMFLVRFRPDAPDTPDVFRLDDNHGLGLLLLPEPSGTVVIVDGARFVRRTLDEVGTRTDWPGRAEVDPRTGTITVPGLNDYITEIQPAWAADPSLFGLAIAESVRSDAQAWIEFDETTGVVSITYSGLLDDSIAATRQLVQTERADDGLLRFVSGTSAQQCQPGRGHQDFSTEPCI